jgi:mono/diheme cytochrome c family protein
MQRLLLAAMLLAVPQARAQDNSLFSHGKTLVESNCAGCHAVGEEGASPHPDAPPFRTLHLRYPIESLAEALAEGISTGHPDMPEFVASPDQIGAIIAYIGSLDRK